MTTKYPSRRPCLLLVLAVLVSSLLALPARAQWWGSGNNGGASEFLELIAMSDLDFGTVATGTGVVTADKNYRLIGKFKIRARIDVDHGAYPEVDLQFIPPTRLSGPSTSIPYEMEASTNSEADDPSTSTVTNGTTARIRLKIYEGSEYGIPVYSGYAYVFGEIDVTNVRSGTYESPLELQAEHVSSTPPVCRADSWNSHRNYREGDIVTWDGAAWEATERTKGDEPGHSSGWGGDDDNAGWNDDDDNGGWGKNGNGNGNGNSNGNGNGNGNDDDGGSDQVTLCHIPPGNPSNQHTIEVGQGAVNAHLNHGDYLGPCGGGGDDDDDDGGGNGHSPWHLITLCP